MGIQVVVHLLVVAFVAFNVASCFLLVVIFVVSCVIIIIASICNFENMLKQHCGSCDVSM
jgi:hypothetical protein